MRNTRWLVALGLLAALCAGTLRGSAAYAQESGPPRPAEHWQEQVTIIAAQLGIMTDTLQTELVTNHKSVAQVATEHSVALSAIVDALVAEPAEHLADDVAAGRSSQADADARLASLRDQTTQQLNRPGWPIPPRRSPYDGPGYPEAPLQEQLDIIAAKLGITADALRGELNNHKAVAQLAGERNVAVSTIVDALTAEFAADLAGEVTAGRMSQEAAADRLADLREDTATHLGWSGWPIPPADGGNNHWREQVEIIAGTLGIGEDALTSELVTNHKTVAQLASDHNVTLSAIVDALVAEPAEGLAAEVEDGRISQAEADTRLANLRDVTTQQLNRPGWPVPPGEGQ